MADTTITFGDDEFNDPPMGDMEGLDDEGQYDTSLDFGYTSEDPFIQRPGEAPVFTAANVPKSEKDKSKDDINKIVAQKVKELTQKNKEAASAEKKRRTKEMRREDARERRQFQRQKRRDLGDASERRKQIRQDAVTKRVQAYSVTAALGLPGYIGASVIDQFFLRPREEAAMEAEKEYQREYQEYLEALEDERIARRENNEDYIDSIVPADVDAGYIKKQLTKNLEKGKDYNPRSKGFKASGSFQNSRGGGGGKSSVGIVESLLGGFNSGGQGGGGTPPGAGGLQPPSPPGPPSNNINILGQSINLAGLGQTAMLIGGVVKVSQAINSYIDSSGKTVQQYSKSLLTQDDPAEYAKSEMRLSQKLYDPLGVNVPVQVFVTGMDVLLSLTQDLVEYAKKDVVFSPMALSASIEGSIEKLMKTIELGSKTDPVKASIIQVWTEFEVMFMEFKAYFVQNFGPFIIANLRLVLMTLKTAEASAPYLVQIAEWVQLGPMNKILKDVLFYLIGIHDNTKPGNNMPSNITKQIEDFMDPNKQIQNLKNTFNFPNVMW